MADHQNQKHHHVLADKTVYVVGTALAVLTIITVWVAGVDLGRANFLIAFLVASLKASLVALYFMNLKHDARENSVIFGTSFLFLAIFIVLAGTDLFFRGDVYVKGSLVAAETKSKYKDPWVSRPELVAHGKELFAVQCISCHGAAGHGDGPAAAALNPHPRNFVSPTETWKNGRKPTMVFKTLKEGIAGSGMASFATLPSDDRWALAHYVLTLGAAAEKDTAGDFAKIGVDPNKAGGGETEAPTISIKLAMEQMAVSDAPAHLYHANLEWGANDTVTAGRALYQAKCVQCHGTQGEGGIKVRNMGVNPVAYVVTAPFAAHGETVGSEQAFSRVVIEGLSGEMMPAQGQLSATEIRELQQYVRGLSSR
jgi:caa(3)-type oxidase subunit IV